MSPRTQCLRHRDPREQVPPGSPAGDDDFEFSGHVLRRTLGARDAFLNCEMLQTVKYREGPT